MVGMGMCPAVPHVDRETYRGRVTRLEVKRDNDHDRYLVFARLDNGWVRVFENTDSLLEGKLDSSDVQAGLEEGRRYEFQTYGWRIPLFSQYENIIGVRELPGE